jgi:hypothetical protein
MKLTRGSDKSKRESGCVWFDWAWDGTYSISPSD